jgi:hypothetical protein
MELEMESLPRSPALLEALSDRILHGMPHAVWREVFLGAGQEGIRFEQRQLSLVHVDSDPTPGDGAGHLAFRGALKVLAARYGGQLDPIGEASALLAFDEPAAAVRMAMALQRRNVERSLRVGVVSGPCVLGEFEAAGYCFSTPVGTLPDRAARAAAAAASGSIVISPETYGPLERELDAETTGCLLMHEYHDSNFAHATITFTPPNNAALSTFAGLGLT